jgi:hypothetical protein
VKLLLDENRSDSIIPRIVDLFPDSTHATSGSEKWMNAELLLSMRLLIERERLEVEIRK